MDTRISPTRLARAIWLDVEPLGYGHTYRVTGGARSHIVNLELGECDCWFALITGGVCSHQYAAGLREGEPSLILGLRELVDIPARLWLVQRRAA